MVRLVSLCLVAVLSSGCTTYAGSKTVAKVGGAMMLAGVPMALGAVTLAEHQGSEARGIVIGTVGLALAASVAGAGLVLGVSGLIGMAHGDGPWTTGAPSPGGENGLTGLPPATCDEASDRHAPTHCQLLDGARSQEGTPIR